MSNRRSSVRAGLSRGQGGVRRLASVGSLALLLSLALALGSGCKAPVRCDEARNKPCAAGLEKVGDTIEASCEGRYDGECDSEWADYVSCVADEAPTCYDRANNQYVHKSPCYGQYFKAFSTCQCKYETSKGGSSPWCGM